LALSERLLTELVTTALIRWILLAASWLAAASWLISLATTAKPLPASPALAASIEAFNASRLV